MSVKRGIFRLWITISVIWSIGVIIVFYMGVDKAHFAEALPVALFSAVIPPVLLKIAFSVVGWIVRGFAH
jgi:hypothetical protein